MAALTPPLRSSKRNANHSLTKAPQFAQVRFTPDRRNPSNELQKCLRSLHFQPSDVTRKDAEYVDYTPPQPTLKRCSPIKESLRRCSKSKSLQRDIPCHFEPSPNAKTFWFSPRRPPRPSAHDSFQPELPPASPADRIFMPPKSLRKPHRPGGPGAYNLFKLQLPPESPGDAIRMPPTSLRKPHRPCGDEICRRPSDLLAPHMALREAVFTLPSPVVMKLFVPGESSPQRKCE